MKYLNLLATSIVVVLVVAGTTNAFPSRKRMVYYQQPMNSPWYGAPQHMMYVQYVQPADANARSTQAAAALVSGDTVATQTFLENCDPATKNIAVAEPAIQHGEEVLSTGIHTAQSVAEAYPDEGNIVVEEHDVSSVEVDSENQHKINVVADLPIDEPAQPETPVLQTDNNKNDKVPRYYGFKETSSNLPAPEPIVPVASAAISPPVRHYLPSKKKVYIELDQSAETEVDAAEQSDTDTDNAVAIAVDDEETVQEDEEETDVAVVVPVKPKKPAARRPVVKKPVKPTKNVDCVSCAKAGGATSKPSKPQLPAGTFFPINFGGTAGGAIAIANSFSTGEGGSATSHAIAYGSPDSVRARVHKPSKLH